MHVTTRMAFTLFVLARKINGATNAGYTVVNHGTIGSCNDGSARVPGLEGDQLLEGYRGSGEGGTMLDVQNRLAVLGGPPVRERFLVFGEPYVGEEEIAEVVNTLRSGWLG